MSKLLQKIANNSIDDIIAFLSDPENANPLTPKQQEELLYYEWADNFIMRYGALNPTPGLLLAKINRQREIEKKDPISKKTVYRYISNAQLLFGSTRAIQKDYWKSVMLQKEFERYLNALRIGDQKAAKGASQEMRHWGSIHVNDDDKVNKKDLGEKNQLIIIATPDKNILFNLDDTYNLPNEALQEVRTVIEQDNINKMLDALSKEAEDAEYTELDPE